MLRTTYQTLVATAAVLALTLAASPLAAESTSVSNGLTLAGGPLAIHGYDSVAYFTTGEPVRGRAEFSRLHDGAVYRFASARNLAAFERDPGRYAPEFGGFCAYGVAVGKKFDGDPEVFAIVDGKLYFNLNPDIQATWNEDRAGNIAKAREQWRAIRDQPAGSL